MASSLEVMRQTQRITSSPMTSPGQYPMPPTAQKRLLGMNTLIGASNIGHQSRILPPAGVAVRHSWASTSSSTLLSNRVRLNLRLSAPTPGEEELCRHWMKNSAKYCRRNNEDNNKFNFSANHISKSKFAGNDAKIKERPRTVQTPPGHPHKGMVANRVQSAERRRIMTSPNIEYMTSSDSERITSPSASNRSSPPARMKRPSNRFPSTRRPSVSSYSRGNSPLGGNKSDLSGNRHDNGDVRSQPRPPSARPSEARLRNRLRASHSPTNLRTNSEGKSRDIRRWSYNETMLNQQNDSKDDDSAYSSSRDVTTDRGQRTPNQPNSPTSPLPRSPPRSAPNLQNENVRTSSRLDVAKGYGSRVMVSGQDGRPVFYYHNKRQIEAEDNHLFRHNPSNYCHLLPLRQQANSQQRPVTQPAMETQHSRNAYKRRTDVAIIVPTQHQNKRIEKPEDKLIQRVLPPSLTTPNDVKSNLLEYHVGPKFYPISLGDYDVLNKQRRSLSNEPKKLLNHYIDPEVGNRIIQWLASVEQNPEVYYGFETDLMSYKDKNSTNT